MANEEQLSILKQGVNAWNQWREEYPDVDIDLNQADLTGIYLVEADLQGAGLFHTNLKNADLRQSNLIFSDLRNADLSNALVQEAKFAYADLSDANLTEADLSGAKLNIAKFDRANFNRANLRDVYFRGSDLSEANLSGAELIHANLTTADLSEANLKGTNLTGAKLGGTKFTKIDLSKTIGLGEIKHLFASTIGTDTLQKSLGKIPKVFLQGCGLSDWEIEAVGLYNPDLNNDQVNKILYKIYDLRATQALQISPLFISYSHVDSEFVDKVGDHLDQKGIRYWRDIHKATAGPVEEQVNRAIRQNPTVLVILSQNSIMSDWVEHEVRTARETGKELGRHVLCPVALDNSWENSPWPQRVMEQVMEYNILDFSEWEDDVKFEGMFHRLIDGLELFYKG